MSTPKPKAKWWQIALVVPLAPVLLVVVVLALVCFVIASVCLHGAVETGDQLDGLLG
jgi:hypothetical protein